MDNLDKNPGLSVAFLVLLPRAARAGIVAAGFRRVVADGGILQLITRDEAPLSFLAFETTLLAVAVILSVLRVLRFERDERLVVVDLFGFEDLQPTPVRRLRPLADEIEIDLLLRVGVSCVDDEIDGSGNESRVASAHLRCRRLAFTSAVDDGLAAVAEKGTGTARARLHVFRHK